MISYSNFITRLLVLMNHDDVGGATMLLGTEETPNCKLHLSL